ncbi:PREDICTED: uncharacterized protein LOC106750670, partial [Dinoponera quadriceps]|uniref:Uncharacterized protein LOC106750670 n=1 Tax=Dinoponera quadriceps TaxID=609295 RepID=A0A6P3Y6L6_DINQU
LILNSVLISPVSYQNMSRELRLFEHGMKICPNIIVSVEHLRKGRIWEWIKIGNVIIKNISSNKWPKYVIFFDLGVMSRKCLTIQNFF